MSRFSLVNKVCTKQYSKPVAIAFRGIAYLCVNLSFGNVRGRYRENDVVRFR